MMEIPPRIARQVIYLGIVTAILCSAIGVATKIRRAHPFDRAIHEASRITRLPAGLIAAVIWKESRFDPSALGGAGEIGLMQITAGAATDWAKATGHDDFETSSLWDPAINIAVGSWYLGRAASFWHEQDCRDPMPFALAEYNAGRGNAQKWFEQSGTDARKFIEAVGFPTTRTYIEEILFRYRNAGRRPQRP